MIALGTAATRYWRTSLLAAAFAAVPLLLASAVLTQGSAANSPALRLITAIPINGTAGIPSTKLFAWDISWVDPVNGLYFLADKSNAAIDVIDTTGAFTGTADTLFGQIGGSAVGFKGDTGVSFTGGPDGVVSGTSGGITCIFAGDGDSTLKSFSSAAFTKLVSTASTGGQFRVDEMAIDVADGLVLAANNADDPAFSTLFTYSKTTCALSNPIKTTFSALPGGHTNTNGIEQPVWDPTTKAFYVSLPEIDAVAPLAGGAGITGAVAKVDTSGVIQTIYPINYCQPAGLTLGPNGDLLVGCNSVFGLDGKKCSSLVPSPSPNATVGHPALCTATAQPQAVVCNPGRNCTGNALVGVPGAGGGDEIFFNAGDGNYYVTAGNNPIGPTVGVIASVTNKLSQLIPMPPPAPATNPATPPGHSAGSVHSIAASALNTNHHVYIPTQANLAYPNCAQGCIAVFGSE